MDCGYSILKMQIKMNFVKYKSNRRHIKIASCRLKKDIEKTP